MGSIRQLVESSYKIIIYGCLAIRDIIKFLMLRSQMSTLIN